MQQKRHYIKNTFSLTDSGKPKDIVFLDDRSIIIITEETISLFKDGEKPDTDRGQVLYRPDFEKQQKQARQKYLQTQKEAGFDTDTPEGYCMIVEVLSLNGAKSGNKAVIVDPDMTKISNLS